MRIAWNLALIALGAVLVYSTRNATPGFSEVRALGLTLLAIGGGALLPRYPAGSHPGAPAAATGPELRPARSHSDAWPSASPVSGPAFVRPAHQRVPLPALPAQREAFSYPQV